MNPFESLIDKLQSKILTSHTNDGEVLITQAEMHRNTAFKECLEMIRQHNVAPDVAGHYGTAFSDPNMRTVLSADNNSLDKICKHNRAPDAHGVQSEISVVERVARIEKWIDFWETIETGWSTALERKPKRESSAVDKALANAAEILAHFNRADRPMEGNKLEEWQACYAMLFKQMNDLVELSNKRQSEFIEALFKVEVEDPHDISF